MSSELKFPADWDFIVSHTPRLAHSFKKWTGQDLVPGNFAPDVLASKMFNAPFVVVSHGTEPDPILNYGNAVALGLWEMCWEEFIRTPSRLTAEPATRQARAQVMETVARRGFFQGYSGTRISKSGRRFEISGATIWNLVSETGQLQGQAASFSRWKFL